MALEFDSRKWTGRSRYSDPIMRKGDLIQWVYWKIHNALHAKMSRGMAFGVVKTRLLSAYVVPHKSAAQLNIYIGRSWIGRDGRSKGKTWKISVPLKAFDVEWSVWLSKKYPPVTIASGVVVNDA